MVSLKAHFDGQTIVLDEPADLQVGQSLRVVIDEEIAAEKPLRKPRFGFAKGKFNITMSDDFNEPLDEFSDYR